MVGLTKARNSPRHPDAFPVAQLSLLALVRVAEPIALTSIFPYAIKLAAHYGASELQAPFFAGILISAFSLAEACTGMFWGGLSDRIGRKPVLLMGCLGTILSLLIVGFSSRFWIALAGRILGGVLNGNIGVIQTMVGELVKNPKHEPKASLPASIGGYFAEPADNFPAFFSQSGLFAKFPYLLPNLICTGMLVLAIIAGYFLLEETHPDMQAHGTVLDAPAAETPLLTTQGSNANAPANLATESYGTFSEVDAHRNELQRVDSGDGWIENDPSQAKVFTKTVLTFVTALGIFTYHSMTYDHLLPIFLQDKRGDEVSSMSLSSTALAGGLGLPLQTVGIIMSVNGLIELFIQAVVFPALASFFGVWKLLVLVTIAHPITYFVVPFLQLLPVNILYPGIFACLAFRTLTAIVAFPLLLIMVKEAAPSPNHLGKINGLAASTGAACRTVASPVAGLLYGMSINMRFTPLAWWASSLVAIVGVMQIPCMARARKCNPSALSHRRESKNESMNVMVHDFSEDEA